MTYTTNNVIDELALQVKGNKDYAKTIIGLYLDAVSRILAKGNCQKLIIDDFETYDFKPTKAHIFHDDVLNTDCIQEPTMNLVITPNDKLKKKVK